jgi:hypothetical protein
MERSEAEQEVVRYFLGDVTEAERDRIGEKTVVDLEYAEFAEGVAFELMDSYARKTLAPAERAKFERFFLVSEERREQVLAMSVLASSPEQPRKGAEPASAGSWWAQWFGNAGFGLKFAGGFAVLAVAALQGWLISEWWPRREAPVAVMGSLTPEISVPLTRGAGETQEWRVSRETAYAALNLAVSDVGSAYRVELQQDGRALWREEGTRLASIEGMPVIVVLIPTSVLVENTEYTIAWQNLSTSDSDPSYRRYRVKYAQ